MKSASMTKEIPMQAVKAPGKRFSLPIRKKSAAYHEGFAARCRELGIPQVLQHDDIKR